MGARRSIERKEFLSDIAIQACYHSGYGFPEVEWATKIDYTVDFTEPFCAIITDRYMQDRFDPEFLMAYEVNIDRIAHGINLIIKGDLISAENRDRIRAASKANDASDLDVVDALAILECAIFGKVVYC